MKALSRQQSASILLALLLLGGAVTTAQQDERARVLDRRPLDRRVAGPATEGGVTFISQS